MGVECFSFSKRIHSNFELDFWAYWSWEEITRLGVAAIEPGAIFAALTKSEGENFAAPPRRVMMRRKIARPDDHPHGAHKGVYLDRHWEDPIIVTLSA